MGCGGSSDAEVKCDDSSKAEAPQTEAKPEAKVETKPQGTLKNHAGAEDVVLEDGEAEPVVAEGLCKFDCGCQVAPGKTRSGRSYDTCCRTCAKSPCSGVHDERCRGPLLEDEIGGPGLARSAPRAAPKSRPVCEKAARCRQRTPGHLRAWSHPLDKDYANSCGAAGIVAEPLSLKVLFDWADEDGSGKLSKGELTTTLRIIRQMEGGDAEDMAPMSESAWKALDEDGNGVVNFSEFASWAGPRLGLPLGIQRMMQTQRTGARLALPCSILGCPCESFEGDHAKCSTCKHKKKVHAARTSSGEVMYPEYWKNHSEDAFHEMVPTGDKEVEDFQSLLNKTHKNSWTRDRTRHNPDNPAVPSGYRVTRVLRNENSGSWMEYACRRAELITRVAEAAEGGQDPYELFDVKTTTALDEIGGAKAERLTKECNEWYLFHGTSPEAAAAICSSDFKVSCAGSNTGTLYGRGVYFGESITKADEYAKQNTSGTFAVLLCRILGGRVKYTAEVTPDPEDLVNCCVSGPYDIVLGDREACKGTFKEFVLFDSEDVFPEYVIEYERQY